MIEILLLWICLLNPARADRFIDCLAGAQHESFALEVEDVLFADWSAGSDVDSQSTSAIFAPSFTSAVRNAFEPGRPHRSPSDRQLH
jgi:hypothetical protein